MRIDGAVIFERFEGGINVKTDEFHLPENQFIDGNNLTINPFGRVSKRFGSTLFNASLGASTKSLDRPYIGSSTTLLAKSGTVLYEDANLDGAFTSLVTGLTSNRIRGVVYDGWFYYCDGTNMYKYDLTNNRAWGIAVPTTAITATPVGAGSAFPIVTGYTYAYTYIRGTEAETKPKQSASTGADLTADRVDVVITASADAQVTGINLYRTTDGGTVLYFHSTQANTTATIADTTPLGGLTLTKTTAALSGNIPPTAADYVIKAFRRVILGTKTTRVIQMSEIGQPESFPGTNNGYTYTINDGDGNLLMGIIDYQNAVLFFKDFSLIAGYGFDGESPSQFSYREVGKGAGLWASDTLVSGLSKLFWVSQQKGVIGVTGYDGQYLKHDVGLNIEPLLNRADKTYMANAVGWFYDNKYFLSFPHKATSVVNDCIYFYDIYGGGWFPYTLDFGVTSAVVADGTGDNGQLFAGRADGSIDTQAVNNLYTDREEPYQRVLQTRYGNAGNLSRKKFWSIYAEAKGSRDKVTVITGDGKDSIHYSTPVGSDGWVGPWIGIWEFDANTQCDAKLAQGMKHRYVSARFEELCKGLPCWIGPWIGPWSEDVISTQRADVISASIEYEIETRT